MAALSPWPATCSAAELAALLDVSARRVRELAQEGVVPRAPGGRYETQAGVRGYIASLRAAAKAKPTAVDPQVAAAAIDGRQQRARLARLQADRVQLDLERERGRLVDAEVIRGSYVTLLTQVRNRLLGVPSAAKGEIPHLTVEEIEILEGLIVTALEEVADGDDEDSEEENEA